ncbi:MAG: hypothetical protein M3309_14115 [Actinomycetota bacterium]|nr:hypothetical protein [Actinomycetota bacterium]
MEHLIEREQIAQTGNPEREAQTWAHKIEECDRHRAAYQDQQAAGLMTLQELGVKLNELENIRTTAEQELQALKTHRERMDDLENDYVAVLESMSQIVPEALNSLTGEERNRIYRMMRLEVSPASAGYEVNGAFCTSETRWGSGAAKKRRSSSLGKS